MDFYRVSLLKQKGFQRTCTKNRGHAQDAHKLNILLTILSNAFYIKVSVTEDDAR